MTLTVGSSLMAELNGLFEELFGEIFPDLGRIRTISAPGAVMKTCERGVMLKPVSGQPGVFRTCYGCTCKK